MPRKLRIEYPGAIYHPPLFNTGATSVMSRGNRREDIFHDDVDRQDFVKSLAEARQKAGWQVHAFCLMRNRFHLVVETPGANLVAGMRWLLGACAIRLNNRHKLFGRVFDKSDSGDLPRESRDAKAGRMAREELRRLGWVEADLSRRPKNDPAKLALAARLRRETTATIKEIAARVKLGTSKRANTRLHARMKNPARHRNAK